MPKTDNMNIWKKVCETNPAHTKKVSYGARHFTTIDAQSQIKKATEIWGPYGHKWGLRDFKYEQMPINEKLMMHVTAEFVYPASDEASGGFPISSAIMVLDKKLDDEWAKKIETDILTKALSRLGFNSDVFEGRFDDHRYVENLQRKYEEGELQPQVKEFIDRCIEKAETEEQLEKAEQALKDKAGFYWNPPISKRYWREQKQRILDAIKAHEEMA
jgi:hypothetical protein